MKVLGSLQQTAQEVQLFLTHAFPPIITFIFVPPLHSLICLSPHHQVFSFSSESFLLRPFKFSTPPYEHADGQDNNRQEHGAPDGHGENNDLRERSWKRRWRYLRVQGLLVFFFFENFFSTWWPSHLKQRPVVELLQRSHGHRAGSSPGSWTSRCSWTSHPEPGWRRHLMKCLPQTPPSSGSDPHLEETASRGSKTPLRRVQSRNMSKGWPFLTFISYRWTFALSLGFRFAQAVLYDDINIVIYFFTIQFSVIVSISYNSYRHFKKNVLLFYFCSFFNNKILQFSTFFQFLSIS